MAWTMAEQQAMWREQANPRPASMSDPLRDPDFLVAESKAFKLLAEDLRDLILTPQYLKAVKK